MKQTKIRSRLKTIVAGCATNNTGKRWKLFIVSGEKCFLEPENNNTRNVQNERTRDADSNRANEDEFYSNETQNNIQI